MNSDLPVHRHALPVYTNSDVSRGVVLRCDPPVFVFSQDTDSLMEWWNTVERESQSDKSEAAGADKQVISLLAVFNY